MTVHFRSAEAPTIDGHIRAVGACVKVGCVGFVKDTLFVDVVMLIVLFV